MSADISDRRLEDLKIGHEEQFEYRISEQDVASFAALSGDHNPLHTDAEYAKKNKYSNVVVHGMFLGALVSRLIGMQLPGRRALLMQESLRFKSPVYPGDTVRVSGKVISKSDAAGLIEVKITISVSSEVVTEGTVHVRVL